MMVRLHKRARTTPAIRAEIAASDEPIQVLARRCHVSPSTIFRWKHRDSFEDRSHTHRTGWHDADAGAGDHRGGAAQDPAAVAG
jgi:hypothetical protein